MFVRDVRCANKTRRTVQAVARRLEPEMLHLPLMSFTRQCQRDLRAQRRASAADVLRPATRQAKRDNLTATPMAGRD